MRHQPGDIFVTVRGIDRQEELKTKFLVGQFIDEEVVDAGSILITEDGVMGIQHRHFAGVVGYHLVDEGLSFRAANEDLPHMVDIEQPCAMASGMMLLDGSGRILNRHLPTGEWDHSTAMVDMPLIELCWF